MIWFLYEYCLKIIYLRTGLLTFFSAFILVNILTPLIINIGKKLRLYDFTDYRKEKKFPTVRVGGLSVVIAFLSAVIISKLTFFQDDLNFFNTVYFNSSLFIGLVFFILGLLDDLFQLGPFKRLLIQFASSLFISLNFFNISSLNISIYDFNLHVIYLPWIISVLFNFFWLAGITNGINWTDGIDGLAAGLVCIFSLAFMIIGIYFGNVMPFVFSTALLGTTLGFLKFNSYPAKIFMGDSGSYFLGINIALISIFSPSNQVNPILEEFPKYLNLELYFLFPIFVLLVPLLDMILVIFKRLLNRKSIFYPDRTHLHHRLMNYGITEQKTVYIIYVLAILSSLFIFIDIEPISIFSLFAFISLSILLLSKSKKLTLFLKYFFNLKN